MGNSKNDNSYKTINMTTQYHYADGENHFGPFTIEELKDKKITKDTLIWYEGLDTWTKAEGIKELDILFKSIPPPLAKTPPPISYTTQTGNKSIPNISMKKSSGLSAQYIVGGLIIFIIIFLAFIAYRNSSTRNSNIDNSSNAPSMDNSYSPEPLREKSPEELRKELFEKEKRKPIDYLTVSYRLKYKIFSGKDEISGSIVNAATIATFKDIILSVTYLSETNTELSRQKYTVYEYVYPNSSTKFLIKTSSPKGTKKIGVKVSSAQSE